MQDCFNYYFPNFAGKETVSYKLSHFPKVRGRMRSWLFRTSEVISFHVFSRFSDLATHENTTELLRNDQSPDPTPLKSDAIIVTSEKRMWKHIQQIKAKRRRLFCLSWTEQRNPGGFLQIFIRYSDADKVAIEEAENYDLKSPRGLKTAERKGHRRTNRAWVYFKVGISKPNLFKCLRTGWHKGLLGSCDMRWFCSNFVGVVKKSRLWNSVKNLSLCAWVVGTDYYALYSILVCIIVQDSVVW